MGKRKGAYRVLEDPAVNGRRILKWIFKKWDGGMKWINLAQKRGSWRNLVNAVMNFWFSKMRGISCLSEKRLTSQEVLCSVELSCRCKEIAL
jgi:predicted double-glycine peptidase